MFTQNFFHSFFFFFSCSMCHSSDIRTVIYVFVIIWPAIYIRCHRFGLCGNVPEFAPSMVFSVQSRCFLCVPKMYAIVCTWNNAEGNEWGKPNALRRKEKEKQNRQTKIYTNVKEKCINWCLNKQRTNKSMEQMYNISKACDICDRCFVSKDTLEICLNRLSWWHGIAQKLILTIKFTLEFHYLRIEAERFNHFSNVTERISNNHSTTH